ncbi:hypothetical protein SPSPH_040260 [Sporomusa sphaeroides DSM 2875]|uniref:Uncharacterized protein n=1 Tax=Sporomusa sphaeroides DSM 2875 TaxID=1337886 RepID=A0ABM9W702_9FIRM|nr:hypothetical protein SPSPH_40060 [Sporomusa sphaeroides DSM 2875]CVK20939.1 hypothetical protein SSPH_03611 [Sporomusa sphaeroides DSM 2875]
MRHVMPPDVKPGRNVFGFEDFHQVICVLQRFFLPGPLPGTDNHRAAAELIEKPGVCQIGKIVNRTIIINVIVHKIAHTEAQIIDAAQSDGCIKNAGILQRKFRAWKAPRLQPVVIS